MCLGLWIIKAKGSETVETLVIIFNYFLKCPMIHLTNLTIFSSKVTLCNKTQCL